MDIYTPYTYLIGWSKQNKFYYGVRYAKNCHPSDLWVTYFTSSIHVNEFREMHGEPDIIQIRKEFTSADDAVSWEHRVLKRISARTSDSWLNLSDGINHVCLYKTEEHKRKIAKSNSKPKTGAALKACIENGKKGAAVMRGKKRPEHSKFLKELYRSGFKVNYNRGEDHHMYGKTHTVDARNKISESTKHRARACCIKCHKTEDGIHEGLWVCHIMNHHKDC